MREIKVAPKLCNQAMGLSWLVALLLLRQFGQQEVACFWFTDTSMLSPQAQAFKPELPVRPLEGGEVSQAKMEPWLQVGPRMQVSRMALSPN